MSSSAALRQRRRGDFFQGGRLDDMVDDDRLGHVARLADEAELEEGGVLVPKGRRFHQRHDILAVEPDLYEALRRVARPEDVEGEVVPAARRQLSGARPV